MKFGKAVAGILIIFCVLLLLTLLIVHPLGLLPATLPERVGVVDSPKHVRLTYQHSPASTITVTWKTETSTAGDVVLYDTVPRCGVPSSYRYSAMGSHHSFTGASGYIHQVELTGLEPDTTYYFVCGGPGGYSGERSFRTAPSSASEFRFVAGGDSRSDPASRTLVSKAMSLTNPSFVMHTGDMVEDGTIQSQWDAWFTDIHDNWIGGNGLSIPVVPCLGNHERNATNYYEQFALPGNEQWYYLDWGQTVRIIILNSEASPSQISIDQTVWLENVLSSASEYQWKIVMFHRNVYYSGGHGNATDIQECWVPLFDGYHVDIVIQGHTHHYHRTKPMNNNSVVSSPQGGTIYVTSGGWGAPLHDYVEQPYSAHGNKTLHFTLISVFQNGTLLLRARDVNGYIFDEIWLHKTVAGSNILNLIIQGTEKENTGSHPLPINAPTSTNSLVKVFDLSRLKPEGCPRHLFRVCLSFEFTEGCLEISTAFKSDRTSGSPNGYIYIICSD